MNRAASHTYQTQSLMTASPARLVAMLYDRAIGSLREAVRAINAGDIEARCRANQRAIEIIGHLAGAVDEARGGEIAANLSRLYRFMLLRLPRVDIKNDARTAEEVIEILEPLRQSWHELADRGAAALRQDSGGAAAQPRAEPSEIEAVARLQVSA